jgi:hypothetical protein
MGNVKDIDRGLNNILAELEKANKLEVVVGILSDARNDGESIAAYAQANEFGTSKIPARPFMGTTIDENSQAIKTVIDKQYQNIVEGRKTTTQSLTYVGEWVKSKIQNTIKNRDFLPALKPSTVAAKKGSTKTLVDTGALINAVQIDIRPISGK